MPNLKKKEQDIVKPRTITVSDRDWEKISKLAVKAGRTRSNYLVQIIRHHLSQTKIT